MRHLLVFGVCTLGVSALYLVPGLTQAPSRTSGGAGNDAAPGERRPTGGETADEGTSGDRTGDMQDSSRDSGGGGGTTGRGSRPATTGATAFTRDVNSPTAISALRTERTRDRLVVRWSAARDDVAVTSYVVELNGFPVAETTSKSVSLRWFKGAGRQQIVQVRALDAAGNVSEPTARLVDRPEPGETPPPDPEPEASEQDPTSPAPTGPDPTGGAPTDSSPTTQSSAHEPDGVHGAEAQPSAGEPSDAPSGVTEGSAPSQQSPEPEQPAERSSAGAHSSGAGSSATAGRGTS